MSELSFEQMLEDSVKTIRNGEIVQGKVIDVKEDEIILNIGYKADGIITKSEYSNDPSVVLTDAVHVGDSMEAKVLKVNDGEGQVILTYKRLAAEKGNKRLEEAFENQEVLKAPVTQVLDGGLCVNVEETRVFIPASLVSDTYEKDLSKYADQEIEFVITEFNPRRRRIIGNRKQLLLAEKAEKQKELMERIHVGDKISFGNGLLVATCKEIGEEGIRVVEFSYEGIFYEVLDKLGTMPLPPYIHETLKDQSRYQTVYAKEIGSAAAPTAGLHFTKELLEKIKEMGVNIAYVTLHVGLGTFRPVTEDIIEDHKMHSEYYSMDKDTANLLRKTRENGKRIIAVGTTSTRVLETIYEKYGTFKEDSGFTTLFLYPSKSVDSIDGLVTNFHLPKSTLLMLVSAIATKEFILKAYNHAVKERYRFFSFGDAMLILKNNN